MIGDVSDAPRPFARPLLVVALFLLGAGVVGAAVVDEDEAAEDVASGAEDRREADDATTTSRPRATTSTTVVPPVTEAAAAAEPTSTTAAPAADAPTTTAATATTQAPAPVTTAPPAELPPLAPDRARITITNSYGRAVSVRLEDAEVVVADLEPGATTATFDLAVASDHADSASVGPVGEACGSSGIGDSFRAGHTYAVTVLDWDGTGRVEGGRCADGTMPALQVRDLTCGDAPYWVGERRAQGPGAAPCGLSSTG